MHRLQLSSGWLFDLIIITFFNKSVTSSLLSCLLTLLNVNVREFLRRLRNVATLRTPALTARKHTCGSLRYQLHKPHVAISRPHDLHSQSSVSVIHYILIAPHFTYPGGMEAMSRACLLRGSNPDLLHA